MVSALEAFMFATGLTEVDRLTFENPVRITNLFRRCYRLMRDKPSGLASEASLLAYAIISECCYAVANKYPPCLRAAIHFMEQNIKTNPKLPAIASAAGVSVRHCIRLFDLHVHEPPYPSSSR